MEQIGKYKVLGELGRGGFGAVYLCEDNLKQKVAVKVFDPKDDVVAGAATSATSDAGEVLKQRFQAEAITLRTLSSNPYIVDLYDFDETEDGIAYYVMPYLEHSLVDEIGKDAFSAGALEELEPELRPRRIPVALAIRVLTEILKGMKAVHREGLVHRDLKPANILFDKSGPEGRVQVCDFGIAKLPDAEHSQSGVGMGSRNYMSPEQRESAKHVDATSDVYAIGIMAYRMLTGTLPGGRFDDPIVFAPTIGQPLNDLVLAAISYEVSERPKDAADFLKQLKAAMAVMDDSAPENEATGTWVEQGESSIRDDLKPLRDQIEKLLLEHGEIPADEKDALEAVAGIADLDATGFAALTEQVADSLASQLKPLKNFLSLIDTRLSKPDFGDSDRKAIKAAGEAIGWDAARVDAVIAQKLASAPSVSQPESPPAKPAPVVEPVKVAPGQATNAGRVMGLVLVVFIFAGGGYWFYDQEQQRAEQQRAIAEQRAERAGQDQMAWDKAEQLNSIESYNDYRSLSVASVEHKQMAATRIEQLEEEAAEAIRQRSASLEAERQAKLEADRKEKQARAQAAAEKSKALKSARQPGQTFKDCDVCPEMVVIPSGRFQMGSNSGAASEKPVHRVTLSKLFGLGKYEVTVGEFRAFAESTNHQSSNCFVYVDGSWRKEADKSWRNPGFRQTDSHPAACLNSDDAIAYAQWLSNKTGKRYRLPSESEWEYAARGGTTTKYATGNTISCNQARYGNRKDGECGSDARTVSVGSYQANAFGLYDMHGNAWEWTQDCWNASYSGAPASGSAWTSGDCSRRVLRGGSWNGKPLNLRSAIRNWYLSSTRSDGSGFRLAQDL